MKRKKAAAGESPLSLKSQRWLRDARVEEALAADETLVVCGRPYRLRDGALAVLAFTRDEDGRTCVGYAVDRRGGGTAATVATEQLTAGWLMVESEPFNARTLGYYQRWLKRHREREE